MPGRVTGTFGSEEVRLENAATESTLELLVEVMNDAAKKLGVKGRDYAKELKGLKEESAAREGVTDKLEEEEDKRKDLNKELDNNKKKFKNFAEDLDNVMRSISAGIGKVFSDATPTVGGFAKAFDGIPIVGGIISTFGEILDNNIKTYRNLASAGIDFGKGMYAAQVAAANAGMPLEVFAKTVAENSQALQTFGGTASQGAQIFANVLGGMKKSGAQQALGRLGMSMDEVANNTATYMEIQARNGRAQTMTQAELQQGALDYNLELDKMARATGLNRKQIDDANKAMARDAKLRVAMARMSEKDQVAWNARIKQLQEAGMTDQAEGLKDLLASGGAAVTKNSAMLVATNQGFADAAQAGFRGVEGSSEMLRGTLEETSRRGKNLSDEQRQQAGILMNYNKSLPGTIEAGLGGMDFSSTKKAAEEQAKALSDPTKNLAAMDQALVDVQNNLKIALLPLLEKFGNILINAVIPALEKLANWLTGKDIGDILLGALVAGIGLMFAKAAASRVLENAIDKLMGTAGGGGGGPDVGESGGKSKSKGKGKTGGKAGLGKNLLKGVKGFGIGTVLGVGADLAADALGRETTAGAAADVLGTTASYAGTGAMIGSVIPGLGTAVGGAVGGVIGAGMGLWENRKALFGTKEPEVKVDPKLANDWAYSVFSGKASMSQVPKGYEDTVSGILSNPPKTWTTAPATAVTTGATAAGAAPTTPGAAPGGIPPEAVQVAQTKTADEIKALASALKDVDYNKLIMPEEAIASMTTGTVEARSLRGEVIALTSAFKDLDNTGLEKITSGLARLDESFKSFNKSFVEDFMAKFKELDKKSQETLLTDINTQMEKLNIGMATLIDVQQGAATGISKTARYTKQSTGNMIG